MLHKIYVIYQLPILYSKYLTNLLVIMVNIHAIACCKACIYTSLFWWLFNLGNMYHYCFGCYHKLISVLSLNLCYFKICKFSELSIGSSINSLVRPLLQHSLFNRPAGPIFLKKWKNFFMEKNLNFGKKILIFGDFVFKCFFIQYSKIRL